VTAYSAGKKRAHVVGIDGTGRGGLGGVITGPRICGLLKRGLFSATYAISGLNWD